jgi:4-amino-4-deoxy-L-arabinose transferase-like glycosyltransferase
MRQALRDKSTKRWLSAVLLIWLGFVFVHLWSLDSGFHWDEGVQIRLVQQTVATADFLPHWYNYPSISYWLSLLSLAPHLPQAFFTNNSEAYLSQITANARYFMSIKALFLWAGSLAILWVAGASRSMNLSRGASLVSTAVIATSWEVSYHLRWIAPDGLVMMWGALWLWLVSQPSQRRLLGAAIVAGLATGTKYPAGLLLLPTLGAALLADSLHLSARLKRAGQLTLACGLAFVVSTPGAVLDTAVFVQNIQWEMAHYAQGHYGYTIAPGLPHLWRMGQYLGLILLAPFKPVALFWLVLAVVGLVAQWHRQRNTAVVMLLFITLYVGYFSQQRVMIVRNLLLLVPFGALWIGWGVDTVRERVRTPAKQILWLTAVTSLLLINAGWSAYAAVTIKQRAEPERFTAALANFITTHPERTFHVSPRVAQALQPYGAWPNVRPDEGETVVVFALEAFPEPTAWPANDPFLIERQFGPYDINFPYYPSWVGNDRVVLIRQTRIETFLIQPAPKAYLPIIVRDYGISEDE